MKATRASATGSAWIASRFVWILRHERKARTPAPCLFESSPLRVMPSADATFYRRLRQRLSSHRRGHAIRPQADTAPAQAGPFLVSGDDTLPHAVASRQRSSTSSIAPPRRSNSAPGGSDEAAQRGGSRLSTPAGPDSHGLQSGTPADSLNMGGLPPPSDTDLWSAAFQEAVVALGSDIDTAILQGKSIERLFQELEVKEQDAAQESRFMKGVQYLRSIKVPLEKFKLALDLATPLTRLEPTVTTVLGVVASVTAVGSSTAAAEH